MLIVYIARIDNRYRWEAKAGATVLKQPLGKCGKYPATFKGAKCAFWYYANKLNIRPWRFALQIDGVPVDQEELFN